MYDIDLNANFIKFLIISDTHIGNKKADMDLIYKAYEYAYSQNIYYVIHLGDVLDSIMLNNKNDLKIHDPNKQMKYVYNEYPYSDDIKTLMLFGNHDYFHYKNFNCNIEKEMKKRDDIISLGYGESFLNINDNYIKLSHDIPYLKGYKMNVHTFLSFLGHYHGYKINVSDNYLSVNVPSLSYVGTFQNTNIPSMLEVTIYFKEKIFDCVKIKCLDVKNGTINNDFSFVNNIPLKEHNKIKEKLRK